MPATRAFVLRVVLVLIPIVVFGGANLAAAADCIVRGTYWDLPDWTGTYDLKDATGTVVVATAQVVDFCYREGRVPSSVLRGTVLIDGGEFAIYQGQAEDVNTPLLPTNQGFGMEARQVKSATFSNVFICRGSYQTGIRQEPGRTKTFVASFICNLELWHHTYFVFHRWEKYKSLPSVTFVRRPSLRELGFDDVEGSEGEPTEQDPTESGQ